MAVTVAATSPVSDDAWGRHRVTVLTVTLDSSYAAGGEPLDFATYAPDGAGQPIFVSLEPQGVTTQGYVFYYDYTNKKIVVFRQKDPAAAGGADIPLPEVAAAVDLSAVILRVLAVF